MCVVMDLLLPVVGGATCCQPHCVNN